MVAVTPSGYCLYWSRLVYTEKFLNFDFPLPDSIRPPTFMLSPADVKTSDLAAAFFFFSISFSVNIIVFKFSKSVFHVLI